MMCQQCVNRMQFVAAALLQMSCHSSRQNLETRGMSSQAGSFKLVTDKHRAALAVLSALS